MKKQKRSLSVEEYMRLPYTIELTPIDGGSWFATIRELVGCSTDGKTVDEALSSLRVVMREWLEAAIEDVGDVPMPLGMRAYSGTFLVRTTPSLHRKLAECADEEGVSTNQLCATILAEGSSHDLAELQKQVAELTAQVKELNSRIAYIVLRPMHAADAWKVDRLDTGGVGSALVMPPKFVEEQRLEVRRGTH